MPLHYRHVPQSPGPPTRPDVEALGVGRRTSSLVAGGTRWGMGQSDRRRGAAGLLRRPAEQGVALGPPSPLGLLRADRSRAVRQAAACEGQRVRVPARLDPQGLSSGNPGGNSEASPHSCRVALLTGVMRQPAAAFRSSSADGDLHSPRLSRGTVAGRAPRIPCLGFSQVLGIRYAVIPDATTQGDARTEVWAGCPSALHATSFAR